MTKIAYHISFAAKMTFT